LLAFCLLLLFPSLAPAADTPVANTLTPKQAADGWLLLFDGESTFGWSAPNGSKWTVAEGMLAPQADKPGLLVCDTAFGDCDLELECKTRADGKGVQVLIGCDAEGNFDAGGTWSHDISKVGGGSWASLKVKVRQGGGRVEYQLRGFGVGSGGSHSGGTPKHRWIALVGNGVVFRNIKLKPVELTPLPFVQKEGSFVNWSDKTNKKSKFSVNPEGELQIKDGPGDLQTTGEWADFVLQAECRTNGKNLNSGIFFRCRPGEYQQGYEAQIHNGFNAQAEKEYTLEVYDPKTHELKDKKKEKFAAMDYGTGAIYRRVPARKAVAKDGEWFTMTVVAQGRHIATWVDGVQVVDWTDNRPLKDNARNGCRLERGPISLQGHDPTTDLSFRNFRIGDLEPKKMP